MLFCGDNIKKTELKVGGNYCIVTFLNKTYRLGSSYVKQNLIWSLLLCGNNV